MAISELESELIALLKVIVDDSTGDISNPNKRVWCIRAAYHRQARKLLAKVEEAQVDWEKL